MMLNKADAAVPGVTAASTLGCGRRLRQALLAEQAILIRIWTCLDNALSCQICLEMTSLPDISQHPRSKDQEAGLAFVHRVLSGLLSPAS